MDVKTIGRLDLKKVPKHKHCCAERLNPAKTPLEMQTKATLLGLCEGLTSGTAKQTADPGRTNHVVSPCSGMLSSRNNNEVLACATSRVNPDSEVVKGVEPGVLYRSI